MEFGDKLMSFSYRSSSRNEWKKTKGKWPILPEDSHLATHDVAKKRLEEKIILISNQSCLNFLFFTGEDKGQEGIKDV